jgi:hypothetical protein
LQPRHGRTPVQEAADKYRRGERKTRPRNIVDELYWPETEVKLFLKRRSTALSLHDMRELEEICKEFPQTRAKVFFEDSNYSLSSGFAGRYQHENLGGSNKLIGGPPYGAGTQEGDRHAHK